MQVIESKGAQKNGKGCVEGLLKWQTYTSTSYCKKGLSALVEDVEYIETYIFFFYIYKYIRAKGGKSARAKTRRYPFNIFNSAHKSNDGNIYALEIGPTTLQQRSPTFNNTRQRESAPHNIINKPLDNIGK